MTSFTIDKDNAIATFEPSEALSKEDFKAAAQSLDPFIKEHGDLTGLIIKTKYFPGWESLGGLFAHLTFIKDHQKHVKKIAFVTDSRLLDLAPSLTRHFVSAQVKTFALSEEDQATQWLLNQAT